MSTFPAAVLWDMDGTLVDTEPYWYDAEVELIGRHGTKPWSEELANELIGSDLLDSAAFIRDRAGVDMEPRAMVEYLLDQVIARLDVDIPWQPGARELLLHTVALGVPCALVTMSWRRLADPVIAQLPEAFAVTVTGDEVPVGQGKPHPAPYLRAAELLGVRASDCIAIEDSPTGAASALAAGCQVIGVPNARVILEAAERLTIVESLLDMTLTDLVRLPNST